MKYRFMSAMTSLCSLCLIFAKLFHWKGVSIILFGEKEYPNPSDY